jgi:hypothetical protein
MNILSNAILKRIEFLTKCNSQKFMKAAMELEDYRLSDDIKEDLVIQKLVQLYHDEVLERSGTCTA